MVDGDMGDSYFSTVLSYFLVYPQIQTYFRYVWKIGRLFPEVSLVRHGRNFLLRLKYILASRLDGVVVHMKDKG